MPNKTQHLAISALGVFLGTSIASAQAPHSKANRTWGTRIHFEKTKIQSTPIISVTLGDSTSARMLVDTGASACWVTDTMANRLGLVLKPYPGNPSGLKLVSIPNMKIGEIPFEGEFAVMEERKLREMVREDIDGVIGATVLSVCPMMIDFSLQILDLYAKGPLTKEDLANLSMDRREAETVPVGTLADGYSPTVTVRVNDQEEISLLLDSGAGYTSIPVESARKLKLGPLKDWVESRNFRGKYMVCNALVKSVSLGRAKTTNIEIGVREKLDQGEQCHLGLDVLARYRIVLDMPAKKLHLLEVVRNNIPVH